MSDSVYIIKNRGISCTACGAVHDFITGLSDKGCMVPLAFSRERAEKIAEGYGLPADNVVEPDDVQTVMLDESARKLPRQADTHIVLAQEVVRSA